MSKYNKILVPTDLSSNSSHAIFYACELAMQNKAELHLLFVHKGEFDEQVNQSYLEKLHRLIDASCEMELRTVYQVESGQPADCIKGYAEKKKIDVIVMGTHGRSGLSHLALGSVAESVIRDAPCPVTVLSPQDSQNSTLSNAIDTIERLVGDGLEKDREEGHAFFSTELVRRLRVPTTTAILMVEQLIDQKWLTWENGIWLFVEGTEFLDGAEIPLKFDVSSENHAVDLVKRSIKLRATDIHIDPINDSRSQIRMRIDGTMQNYCELDKTVAAHLVSQLKTMAKLDIADPFHPLEGRLNLPQSLKGVEVRLATVPVLEGQAAALRILDPTRILKPLDKLGLGNDRLEEVQRMIQQNSGLVLVTGPTGSGKTTTVYSMLETIDSEANNIVSIEDPVEFSVPFVRQISVDYKNNLTMTSGLKTLLRMDPDVIFVGEIRDCEAAKIAMQAASSGKSVFATMHTRDIASTVLALLNFGLSHRHIASHLSGVVNQRLARCLCSQCKASVAINETLTSLFESNDLNTPERLFESNGCKSCNFRGYHSRVGIFECSLLDQDFFGVLEQSQKAEQVRNHLRSRGVKTLVQDALSKAAKGIISPKEAVEVQWT